MDREQFKNPGAGYRGAPFWAWNGDLRKEELERQIDVFEQMGFGGFFMHARAGLITKYLSDEFMQSVRDCCLKAGQKGMKAWLYDEDRYPSGPAGGLVTRNPAYTRRFIRFSPEALPLEILADYDVQLDSSGDLAAYSRLPGASGCGTWHAYYEKQPATTDEQQTYVDTLNPEAIKAFLQITHERYKETVGEFFGNISPGIFTDEPQYARGTRLPFARERGEVVIPWTDGFAEGFREAKGFDILDHLPELVWNLPDGRVSSARYHYYDYLAERFASSFSDTIGAWCRANGLKFTGHLMGEGLLDGQATVAGEMMRNYRAYDIPGVDVLGAHKLEMTTLKQCQSAVRQQHSDGLMSELYGVAGWEYDFRGHKTQGDWQAAMGVTLRVPHHAHYTFNGESKRDYPASISYQDCWYDQYPLIEDHFARINAVFAQADPVVTIGVLHPIETTWLHLGPSDRSGAVIQRRQRQFEGLIRTLHQNFLDFDFISESRLPGLCPEGGYPLQVGAMAYRTVVVPALETMRSDTLRRLERFVEGGGRLIFMGACPAYVDAVPSDAVRPLYERSTVIADDLEELLAALDDLRPLKVSRPSGMPVDSLIHQQRRDADGDWIYIAGIKTLPSPDVDIPNQGIKYNVGQLYQTETLRFALRGEYRLEEWDTLTGEIHPLQAEYRNGWTVWSRRWFMHDSLLLRMIPCSEQGQVPVDPDAWKREYLRNTPFESERGRRLQKAVPVTLDEPNVCLLDMAEYALDDGPWQPLSELLSAENICRVQCGLPIRKRAMRQPYQTPIRPAEHRIRVRFTVESRVYVSGAKLGMESMTEATALWDGRTIPLRPEGWYVDPVIQTTALPEITPEKHCLEMTFPLGLNTKLEYLYLLGDFGVELRGVSKTLTEPVRELAFGSWVHQGLPFYGGKLTYQTEMETGRSAVLRIPQYRGALVRVSVDGTDRGPIIYSPYAMLIDGLQPGTHRFDLTLYATRYNTFAALHHLGTIPFSQGPDCWRSTGDLWNDEYQPIAQGILSSPRWYDTALSTDN